MKHKIDVVIVEPHHHALEHIHYILRRNSRHRRSQTRNNNKHKIQSPPSLSFWTMIHYDSHPDLACPNQSIPARLCFTPRETKTTIITKNNHSEVDDMNLYELLDMSSSGIAEWILPLVLAGGLQTVYWLKNEWCYQFHNGTYSVPVGAWIPPFTDLPIDVEEGSSNAEKDKDDITFFLDLPDEACVKTSMRHNYYLEDDSVVPEDELLLKKELKLIVSNGGINQNTCGKNAETMLMVDDGGGEHIRNQEWILDVCLDYFICSNPFVAELESIDVNIAKLITRAVSELSHRKISLSSILGEEEAQKYKLESNLFHSLVVTYFQNLSERSTALTEITTTDVCNGIDGKCGKYYLLEEQQYYDLYRLYDSFSIGEEIWGEITSYFLSLGVNSKCSSISSDQSSIIPKMCDMIMNGLTCMTLPHDYSMTENGKNQISSSSELSPEVQLKVKSFGDDLRYQRWRYNTASNDDIDDHTDAIAFFSYPPSIITIARSSEDGYTPPNIVDKLQQAVLDQIHEVYCNLPHKDIISTDTTKRNVDEGDNCCEINLVLDYGEYEGSVID